MNILVIGNSFSEDSTYYLHQMAQAVDEEIEVVNLYLPGCSLKQHWDNITHNNQAYRYEKNGAYDLETADKELVSIAAVLSERPWEHIISQQASHDSGKIASFHPYAEKIYSYLKKRAPQAKLWLQETWAYEINSSHPAFSRYETDQRAMFQALKKCYHQVAKELGVPLILTGEVIQTLRRQPLFDYRNGGISLCRDGYHLTYVYGRYVASLVWLQTFCGTQKVQQLEFEPVSRFDRDFQVDSTYLTHLKKNVVAFFS